MDRRGAALGTLLPMGAIVAVYGIAVRFGFAWDDNLILRHIARAQADGGLLAVLRAPFLPTAGVPNNYYRPLVYLTYWADLLLGQGAPWLLHLGNLALHAAASVLVALLALRLFGDRRAALLAGLLFAVHPVHVESVAWIAGRTDLLCAVFVLGATLAWLAASGSRRMLALSALLYGVACFAKESALVLPAVIAAFEASRSPDGSRRRPWAAWALTFVPMSAFVMLARWLALRNQLGYVGAREQWADALLAHDPGAAVLAFMRTLRTLLVPWPHDAAITRESIGLSAVSIASVVALAALVGWAARRDRAAGVLAGAWILGFALPNLLVSGAMEIIAAERYMYLPSVGLSLVAAALLARREAPRWIPVALAALVCALGIAAAMRVPDWRNEDTITSTLASAKPASPLARQLRGEYLLAHGNPGGAVEHFRAAVRMRPADAALRVALASALRRSANLAAAVVEYRKAAELEPDWADPRRALAETCRALCSENPAHPACGGICASTWR